MRYHILTLLALLCLSATAQSSDDQALRQEIRDAYNEARRANTVDSWEIFMNNYKDSYYYEQARKNRDAAIVAAYCNNGTTLERLVGYIDNGEAHEPRIKLFYSNLVNNPTHSYRAEHLDLGFSGCTGHVDEHITFNDGTRARDNQFEFNSQGLLTESTITGSNGRKTVTRYTYAYDNLHGYSLSSVAGKKTVNYAPFFTRDDRLDMLQGDDKSRYKFYYNDNDMLDRVVITTPTSTRTLHYNAGYIIREERDGKTYRYLYDFDADTGKKYLIAIREMNEGKAVSERTFDYTVDDLGRFTRVAIAVDGQPQMTITRKYK